MVDTPVKVDYFDPNTRTFSDPTLAGQQGFGGTSFNIHQKRTWIGKDGMIYVNQVVGFDPQKRQPILKPVRVMANATLRRDEWIEIDRVVMRVARERLVGFDDLMSAGLTYNLTNPMGKTVLEYQDMNDPGEAQMDMNAETKARNDAADFQTKYLPIPIIHSDFTIGQRQLDASRTYGDPLDTVLAEAHTRRVVEKLEDLLFTDTTFSFGSAYIYSYLSFPNINTVTLSLSWTNAAKTGANIKDDVLNMIQASINSKHYGPFVMYIPTAYQKKMGDDYTTGYPKTIRQRLMEIEEITAIKVADRLPADTVVLVQLSTDVVRVINGFSPIAVQWTSGDGLTHHFKIMAIQVPQMRADQAGNCGITVLQ